MEDNKENSGLNLPPMELYELDVDKIQTMEDIRRVMRGLEFKFMGAKYSTENEFLKDYIKKVE